MTYKEKEDICTHLGDDYARFSGAIVPPIFQNSLFVKPNEGNNMPEHGYVYTRESNPTTEIAELKIAALEQGEAAICFSSGMAASVAAIMHFIEKDCHVITIKNVYNQVGDLLSDYLVKFGVEVTYVDGCSIEDFREAIRPNTTLIYLESPSSLTFMIQDLMAVAELAKEHNIGTVIDNTYATPLYQNPLLYGIDIVMHTASKYLGGHSDIIGGVLVSDAKTIDSIKMKERAIIGAIMDPHQAWLLIRGLRTLPVRLKQHEKNALVVAKYLEEHEKVEKVLYPGLESHPQYELIQKQMCGTNGLLSFVLKNGNDEMARTFVSRLKMFPNGCSWGGFESLSVYTENPFKAGEFLIRLHIGLENVDTLLQDIEQALAD